MTIINAQIELDIALSQGESEFEVGENARLDIKVYCVLNVRKGSPRIVTRENSSPLIDTYGNSSPLIDTYGNSSPLIDTYGNSSPQIHTNGESKPLIRTRENSSPLIRTWDNSNPEIYTWENSKPLIDTYGKSSPQIVTRENSSPQIRTYGESNPQIDTYENSSPIIHTGGNSSPLIRTWENSSPLINTRGNSNPLIHTQGNSNPQIHTQGNSNPQITGEGESILRLVGKNINANQGPNCHSYLLRGAKVSGGTSEIIDIDSPEGWCKFYNVKVSKGMALVYKAVNDKYMSERGTCYAPGETPQAPDWDGGTKECGGGLHFSPTPRMALCFNSSAAKFLGCWVKLEEMRRGNESDYCPEKCKSKGVAVPCFEVDINGEVMVYNQGK